MKTDPMKPDRRSLSDTPSRFSGVRYWPMAGVVVLLLAGAALWFRSDALMRIAGSGPPVQAIGTLPARDVAEIRSRVRREIWRGVLPKLDWWSIRNLPAAVRYRVGHRIHSITAQSDGTVDVVIEAKGLWPFPGQWTYFSEYSYLLEKGTGGWQLMQKVYQWGDLCEG